MKELFLVPKHLYEAMHANRTKIKNKDEKIKQWGTTMLPPPLQKKISLNTVKIPEISKVPVKHNLAYKPSLSEQLNVKFKPENLPHARLILKHFEKSSNTQWDEYGDLFSPINGYNIIDIIHDFIFKSDIKDTLKVSDYRFLVSSTDFPIHYIRNNPLKNVLTRSSQFQNINIKTPKHLTKKKIGGGKIKTYRKPSNWSIY